MALRFNSSVGALPLTHPHTFAALIVNYCESLLLLLFTLGTVCLHGTHICVWMSEEQGMMRQVRIVGKSLSSGVSSRVVCQEAKGTGKVPITIIAKY